MEVKILQIEGIEAATLLKRFEGLEDQIKELRAGTPPRQVSEYLTRAEVAEILNVSLVTVHDWVRKGILTAYKVANRIYFKRSDLEQALTPIAPRKR